MQRSARAVRITYTVLRGRRIVLLTVFFKDQQRMSAEVERAPRVMERQLGEEGSLREEDEPYVREIRDKRLVDPGAREELDAAGRALELGLNVRQLRLERGLSQRELARRTAASPSAIGRLETGDTIPRFEKLKRIERAPGAGLVITLVASEVA